jgi:hypothetical protein
MFYNWYHLPVQSLSKKESSGSHFLKKKIMRKETDYGEILMRHSTLFCEVFCTQHRNGRHK